jgi:hypothetical protein
MNDYRKKRKRIERHDRKRELGRNAHPRCSVCGIDRIEMLQLDHTGGDANSELTNWLCKNHHAIISDKWNDTPDLLRHDELHGADLRLASLLPQ